MAMLRVVVRSVIAQTLDFSHPAMFGVGGVEMTNFVNGPYVCVALYMYLGSNNKAMVPLPLTTAKETRRAKFAPVVH